MQGLEELSCISPSHLPNPLAASHRIWNTASTLAWPARPALPIPGPSSPLPALWPHGGEQACLCWRNLVLPLVPQTCGQPVFNFLPGSSPWNTLFWSFLSTMPLVTPFSTLSFLFALVTSWHCILQEYISLLSVSLQEQRLQEAGTENLPHHQNSAFYVGTQCRCWMNGFLCS